MHINKAISFLLIIPTHPKISFSGMAPTTQGCKKKDFKSSEFIEEEDCIVVADESSDAASEEYNEDE